jgi:hypothetical protein
MPPQVKTTAHATRGNNTRARGTIRDCRCNTTTGLQIEKQAATMKHLKKKDTDQNKWTTHLVGCNKNLKKILIDFI